MADSSVWTPARHPLARYLREIAAGSYPPPDSGWTRVAPWSPQVQGIISVTGHAVLAVSYDITDDQLAKLGVDGVGSALSPKVLLALAGERGSVDGLDMLFLGSGTGNRQASHGLVSRPDLAKHPRVDAARRFRQELQVFGRADRAITDVVVLARGVAGLREIFVELDLGRRGQGLGARIVRDALDCVPEHELVAACVPPSNAAGVKALMAAGMTPVGSIQLFSDRPERRASV